jgi:hypothetical protein
MAIDAVTGEHLTLKHRNQMAMLLCATPLPGSL